MSSCPPSPGTGSYPDVLDEDKCYDEKCLPAIVHLKYGPKKEEPWMDKDVAKERFKAKIQALPAALASHLVLKKVHLVDNGYGVKLFLRQCRREYKMTWCKCFECGQVKEEKCGF